MSTSYVIKLRNLADPGHAYLFDTLWYDDDVFEAAEHLQYAKTFLTRKAAEDFVQKNKALRTLEQTGMLEIESHATLPQGRHWLLRREYLVFLKRSAWRQK